MPPRRPRRLVIDASIARAAGGEDAIYPTSKHCREFLAAVLRICHHMVMTYDVSDEWNRHQSAFARRWRVQMVSRKKLHVITAPADFALRAQVEQHAPSERAKETMLKDVHLLEAAMSSDHAVISLDETVRAYFSSLAERLNPLRQVAWLNPDRSEDQLVSWLEGGAKVQRSMCLGRQP